METLPTTETVAVATAPPTTDAPTQVKTAPLSKLAAETRRLKQCYLRHKQLMDFSKKYGKTPEELAADAQSNDIIDEEMKIQSVMHVCCNVNCATSTQNLRKCAKCGIGYWCAGKFKKSDKLDEKMQQPLAPCYTRENYKKYHKNACELVVKQKLLRSLWRKNHIEFNVQKTLTEFTAKYEFNPSDVAMDLVETDSCWFIELATTTPTPKPAIPFSFQVHGFFGACLVAMKHNAVLNLHPSDLCWLVHERLRSIHQHLYSLANLFPTITTDYESLSNLSQPAKLKKLNEHNKRSSSGKLRFTASKQEFQFEKLLEAIAKHELSDSVWRDVEKADSSIEREFIGMLVFHSVCNVVVQVSKSLNEAREKRLKVRREVDLKRMQGYHANLTMEKLVASEYVDKFTLQVLDEIENADVETFRDSEGINGIIVPEIAEFARLKRVAEFLKNSSPNLTFAGTQAKQPTEEVMVKMQNQLSVYQEVQRLCSHFMEEDCGRMKSDYVDKFCRVHKKEDSARLIADGVVTRLLPNRWGLPVLKGYDARQGEEVVLHEYEFILNDGVVDRLAKLRTGFVGFEYDLNTHSVRPRHVKVLLCKDGVVEKEVEVEEKVVEKTVEDQKEEAEDEVEPDEVEPDEVEPDEVDGTVVEYEKQYEQEEEEQEDEQEEEQNEQEESSDVTRQPSQVHLSTIPVREVDFETDDEQNV